MAALLKTLRIFCPTTPQCQLTRNDFTSRYNHIYYRCQELYRTRMFLLSKGDALTQLCVKKGGCYVPVL
jgi:hypothetical protein